MQKVKSKFDYASLEEVKSQYWIFHKTSCQFAFRLFNFVYYNIVRFYQHYLFSNEKSVQ